ncbi:nucleoside triphosphate pyrophosphohydrolase family protein, partial [Tepidimicrobium xylanilyticum]
KNNMENHIKGKLCPSCKDILLEEIGAYLFYLSALANTLDIKVSDAILNEYKNIKTLGIFSLK